MSRRILRFGKRVLPRTLAPCSNKIIKARKQATSNIFIGLVIDVLVIGMRTAQEYVEFSWFSDSQGFKLIIETAWLVTASLMY